MEWVDERRRNKQEREGIESTNTSTLIEYAKENFLPDYTLPGARCYRAIDL